MRVYTSRSSPNLRSNRFSGAADVGDFRDHPAPGDHLEIILVQRVLRIDQLAAIRVEDAPVPSPDLHAHDRIGQHGVDGAGDRGAGSGIAREERIAQASLDEPRGDSVSWRASASAWAVATRRTTATPVPATRASATSANSAKTARTRQGIRSGRHGRDGTPRVVGCDRCFGPGPGWSALSGHLGSEPSRQSVRALEAGGQRHPKAVSTSTAARLPLSTPPSRN